MTVFDKARKQGLIRKENYGLSAKELASRNPELARKLAQFMEENKDELVAAIVQKVTK